MKLFNVTTCPDVRRINRYMRGRYRRSDRNDGIMLSEGIVSEERFAVTPVIVCPFCMERYEHSYYERRKIAYKNAAQHNRSMNDFVRDVWNMNRSEESPDEYFDRGLEETEIEVPAPHFWQKKDTWYARHFECHTCGAVYDSLPYRKDHLVKL